LIIFDTNAVNLLPPGGVRADIIRKLRRSGHHRAAVPWVVLEELAAHQAKHYPSRYQTAVSALAKLREILPWELDSALEQIDLERFLDHWRSVYSEIFEVIETSGDVARRALAREAMALPPAKRAKDHSEGARDVAIWFSIVEFLKAHPDEHVYFVTNNTSDFGNGTAYPYPMDEDIRGLEGRLTRLADFNQVVSTFAKEVSGEAAEAVAEELLRSDAVRERVAQTAVEALESGTGFPGLGSSDAAVTWQSWLAAPEVELLSVNDVTGHEIEGDIWYTAEARWLLYGGAVSTDGTGAESVACVWDMKILFSTNEEAESPTVLSGADPALPDTEDGRCMDMVRRLRESAAHLASRVTGGVLGTRDASAWAASIGSSNATAQILASLPKVDTSVLAAYRGVAAQLAESQPKLDIAGLLPATTAAQQLLASMPKLDTSALTAYRAIAKQLAESQPKLDIAGLLPATTAAQQLLASMPKLDTSIWATQQGIAEQIAGLGGLSAYRFDAARAADETAAADDPAEDDTEPTPETDEEEGSD
jgi:hypothetical protein